MNTTTDMTVRRRMNKLTQYEQEAIDWWNERLSEQARPSNYGGNDYWENDGWILLPLGILHRRN